MSKWKRSNLKQVFFEETKMHIEQWKRYYYENSFETWYPLSL
jgi:hypothetical protein